MSGLAVRRRLADRISSVKRRTRVETPVIDELPLKARVIRSLDFTFPKVRGIIPVMAKGQAYGKTAGRWYRVTFPKRIIDPTVVCVALAKKGDMPRPGDIVKIKELVDVPKIKELTKVLKDKIPDLTIPKWTLVIPTAADFVKLVKGFLGDWGWANWIRDAVASGIGRWEYWIWDKMFRPRGLEQMNEVIQRIQDRINSRLGYIRSTLNTKLGEIDDRLELIRTRLNTRLDQIGDRFETLRKRTEDSLKTLFPRLYEAWGLRKDMAPTILNIKNVTDYGFHFLSVGETTAHWLAVGERR